MAGLLRTPVNFDTDSYTLSASDQQELTQVADRLKACPSVNVAVSGYTDATGNDAINVPLSNSEPRRSSTSWCQTVSPVTTSPREASVLPIRSRAMTRRMAAPRTAAL